MPYKTVLNHASFRLLYQFVCFPFSAELCIMTLQELCRVTIRSLLQTIVRQENPDLIRRKFTRKPRSKPQRKQRHINIMPMNTCMGMMVLGNLDDSDGDSDSGREEVRSRRTDRRLMARYRREQQLAENEENTEDVDEDEEEADMPDILRQMAVIQRRFMTVSEEDEDQDEGLGGELTAGSVPRTLSENGTARLEDIAEGEEATDGNGLLPVNGNSGKNSPIFPVSSSPGTVLMETRSQAIPIASSDADRQRYNSATSMSTSCTSGVGTCSSIDEPSDLDTVRSDDMDYSPRRTGNSQNGHGYSSTVSPKRSREDDDECTTYSKMISRPSKTDSDFSPSCVFDDKDVVLDAVGERVDNMGGEDSVVEDNNEEDEECPSMCYFSSEPSLEKIAEQDILLEADEEEEWSSLVAHNTLNFQSILRQKISQLPIPTALMQFILFYRT